jgi:hypothetical protein
MEEKQKENTIEKMIEEEIKREEEIRKDEKN